MVVIKIKYRNRLDIENDMIATLSSTESPIRKLVAEKQAHLSHWGHETYIYRDYDCIP